MKLSKRLVILSVFLFITLFTGILFGQDILKNIIEPTALVAWLLARIFILSIDQKYYWGAIIFIVAIFFVRFLPKDQDSVQSDDPINSNETLRIISYWRGLVALGSQDVREQNILRQELIRLMLSLYASKQRTPTDYRLYESLKNGEIPLPPHVHSFLFSDKTPKKGWSISILIQTIRAAPQKWIRRWSGQEARDHYRMLEEVLCFMETTLEMKNDTERHNPN